MLLHLPCSVTLSFLPILAVTPVTAQTYDIHVSASPVFPRPRVFQLMSSMLVPLWDVNNPAPRPPAAQRVRPGLLQF